MAEAALLRNGGLGYTTPLFIECEVRGAARSAGGSPIASPTSRHTRRSGSGCPASAGAEALAMRTRHTQFRSRSPRAHRRDRRVAGARAGSAAGAEVQSFICSEAETVRWTVSVHRAVMAEPERRPPHDDRLRQPPRHALGARPPGSVEDDADGGAEAAVARPLRDRAAALQPALPRKPARLPHPGTRLWRAEARDGQRGWRHSGRNCSATTASRSGAGTSSTGRSPGRG